MDTILLMLSGGIDSTYLLYHYLTETENPIHVHHISIRYPQLMRWVMEDPAVEGIVDYCRSNYRSFDYSESTFEMDPMNLIGFDQTLLLLVASKVAPNLPGERVSLALGHCYNDIDHPQILELAKRKTMHRLWQSLRECCLHGRERINPKRERVFLDMKWTKEEIYRKMPAELMGRCWSCRQPDFVHAQGFPCGRCHACKKAETILGKSGQAEEYPNLVRPKHMNERWVPGHDRQSYDPQMSNKVPVDFNEH